MAGRHAKKSEQRTVKLTDIRQVIKDVETIDESLAKHPAPPREDYVPAWRKP